MRKESELRCNRRQFVVCAGAAAADVYSKTVIKPVARAGEFLTVQGYMEDGNVLQRYAKTRRVFEDLVTADGREELAQATSTLIAWFKFNGAQFYASRKDLRVTDQVLTHFLYGEGESIDIKDNFTHSVHQAYKGEEQDALQAYLREQVDNHLHGDVPAELQGEKDMLDLKLIAGRMPRYYVEDLYLSLNRYTLNATGQRTDNGAVIGEISISDRYDWGLDTITSLRSSEVVGMFLRGLGIREAEPKIRYLMGNKWDQPINITDKEGQLLVDRGYAHEFNMYADFDGLDLHVEIPKMIGGS